MKFDREKFRENFYRINKGLIISCIIAVVILIAMHFLLGLLHLKFRQWVYFVVVGFCIITAIIEVVQGFIRLSKESKKFIGQRRDDS